MPPKSSVDGVSRVSASPLKPGQDNSLSAQPADKQPASTPVIGNSGPAVKGVVKASSEDHGPVITVLITLIIMVLIIGLAYFAYNKSK